MSIWDTLAEFTQKCDVSACLLQNTSKSDRDKSTELGKPGKSGLKHPKTTSSWITSDRVCIPCLLAAMRWKSKAFRFPEFIAASPLKREGTFANEEALRQEQNLRTEKTHCPMSKMSSALHAKSSIHTITKLHSSTYI